MTTFVEGNLKIEFPGSVKVRKFDDPKSHGLSHCMKAVDFIVEEANRISFIELKDPEHSCAKKKDREEFIRKFHSGALNEELKYKYRDTFLYGWASGGFDKPISYWVVVAIEALTTAELSTLTDDLTRKLPLNGLPKAWKRERPIAANCMVFNIKTWNETWKKHQPRFRLSRIP